ncbi:MAG: hypothetical protein KH135_02865 [Firmicutes bacterium]|nr:hypothetical protein [Bacillota bacterium]
MIQKHFDTLYIIPKDNSQKIGINRTIKYGEKTTIPFRSINSFGIHAYYNEHPYIIEAILKNIIEQNQWMDEFIAFQQKKIHLIDTTDQYGEITRLENYAFFLTLKNYAFLLSSPSSTHNTDFQMIMPSEEDLTDYQNHCLSYYQEFFRQKHNNYLITIFSPLDEDSYAIDVQDNNCYTIKKGKCLKHLPWD